MSQNELLPCPFCGGPAQGIDFGTGGEVRCHSDNECDVSPHTVVHVRFTSAIAAWNRRIESAQAVAVGGGEIKFAFMAEVCDAAVQAMQANGLIKRTIRLQEVRDQLRQLAAAPASEAVRSEMDAHPHYTEADAIAYIRDWCPDHVKDYIDKLGKTNASEAVGRKSRGVGHLEATGYLPPGTAAEREAAAASSAVGECRCHEGNGARDCAIHTQADFDAQNDHRAEQEQVGESDDAAIREAFEKESASAFERADPEGGWQWRPSAYEAFKLGYTAALLRRAARVEVETPPANCRQRLMREGKPYPRSSCAVCGHFAPRRRECASALEPQK